MFQLEYVGWQLNLQMAQSSQARMKSPSAVLQLGLRSEDSEVWPDAHTHTHTQSVSSFLLDFLDHSLIFCLLSSLSS